MPVMDPLAVCPDYNPTVEDEMLKPIGELNPDSILVLVTLTVPQDVKKMSVNLQAPFIINADERKAIQLIVVVVKYLLAQLHYRHTRHTAAKQCGKQFGIR